MLIGRSIVKNAKRVPFDTLDVLLAAAMISAAATAVLVAFPSARWAVVAVLDVRGWSRRTWFLLNLLLVVVLLGIRLVASLRTSFAAYRVEAAKRRLQAERAPQAAERKERMASRIRRY